MMNKTSLSIISIAGVLGFAVGAKVNQKVDNTEPEQENIEKSRSSQRAVFSTSSGASKIDIPYLESNESLESIMAMGPDCPAGDMALWLVNATETEIAAYWDYRSQLNGKDGFERIILYNWARLDPHGGIAHLAKTKEQGRVFWAWGTVDPEAALAEASSTEHGKKHYRGVVNAIGQMHSGWLFENFDQIPEEYHSAALNGLMNWKENSDHVGKLNFLRENGKGVNRLALKTLTRQDPWAAYEWLNENVELRPGGKDGHYHFDVFLNAVKDTDIDVLERMITSTRSISLRRKIEDKLYQNLVKTDPEAAIQRAKKEKSPLLVAVRLGEVGLSLLSSDPDSEQAFELGNEMLEYGLDGLYFKQTVKYPSGRDRERSQSENYAQGLMGSLLVKDPSRTMDMAAEHLDVSSRTFQSLSSKMMRNNVDSYMQWVDSQDDPEVSSDAASRVVSNLNHTHQFNQVAGWLTQSKNVDQAKVQNMVFYWGRKKPQDARSWVESSGLNQEFKSKLLQSLPK